MMGAVIHLRPLNEAMAKAREASDEKAVQAAISSGRVVYPTDNDDGMMLECAVTGRLVPRISPAAEAEDDGPLMPTPEMIETMDATDRARKRLAVRLLGIIAIAAVGTCAVVLS